MSDLDHRAAQVRRFNRFYTREIGVLHKGLLQSPFSLTEVRVLYDIAHQKNPTANLLCKELGLDAGYVSRIVATFRKRGLVSRSRSDSDGRQLILSLTAKGRNVFADLDQKAHEEVRAKLACLPADDQQRLVESLDRVETLLGKQAPSSVPYVLRPHQPGDIGWVIHRHGVLYAQEYGWDSSFEALVAEIAAAFIRNYDPKRERCWIAERNGDRAGSVFVVRKTDEVAQLRLLLVEPSARGLGLGRHLVTECVRFARQTGYRRMTLWTDSILHAARRIYDEAGFHLVDAKKHHSFGKDLVGETWELEL